MSEWISTALELPKSDGVYRVKYKYYKNGKMIEEGIMIDMFDDGVFSLDKYNPELFSQTDVTHWMPIING